MASKRDKDRLAAKEKIHDLRGIVQQSFKYAGQMEPLRLQHLLRDIDRKLMDISEMLDIPEPKRRKACQA